MKKNARQRAVAGGGTALRAEGITGTRTVEFPDGDGEVLFVADAEYRRVMKARGYDPDADLAEFMDAEDFTGAIRVKINGVSGMLCTT